MSARGELVSLEMPLEPARRALRGEYSVISAGAGGLEIRDIREKLVSRIIVRAAPGDSFWLTLEPLRGYDSDAARIRSSLLGGGFLSEQAWRSAAVPMAAGERADAVVVRVLQRLLEIQDANLPGALAGAHVDFLHDYRVAIRRTRSVLREMRGVLAADELEHVRAGFRWLQNETGPTRDLDVFLEEFGQLRALAPHPLRADLSPIESLLHERHSRARTAMEESLGSERARALHDQWRATLQALALASESERGDAVRQIGGLAGERIRKVHRRMVRMGRTIGPESPPKDHHEMRKQGKELRYLLELFGAQLFDPEVIRPMIKALKGLQDVLGVHQDREVQITMLRGLGEELALRPGAAGAPMTIGILIDRLESDARAARGHFAGAFAQFASEAQCKLVAHEFK